MQSESKQTERTVTRKSFDCVATAGHHPIGWDVAAELVSSLAKERDVINRSFGNRVNKLS